MILKWSQEAVSRTTVSFIPRGLFIEILALICQQYLLKEGLGLCSLQGKFMDLLTLNFFPFLCLWKSSLTCHQVISLDIWAKRGLFPSEFGLRRGYIGKAELSLCSHWVTSIDISKSRLSIIRNSGVSVHWDTPRRSLPWWTDHHPGFRLCLLGLHICAFHCLSTKKSTQADRICRDKLQA